nr:immunoglobulin heavy chain junction region [Mus musculus]MBK4197975.1 immunoglobulin heavy chain junction region [Mus musculus]MBK4197976.1 immunoglobulin heavy chain junction region [Mus musculus]MBK4197977.1 immunoglobulin heavy chain junction region [Mus musculus]MBK4197978.1 immunoglobulin heavy chain junction region [Mus musculus]
CARSKGYPDYW